MVVVLRRVVRKSAGVEINNNNKNLVLRHDWYTAVVFQINGGCVVISYWLVEHATLHSSKFHAQTSSDWPQRTTEKWLEEEIHTRARARAYTQRADSWKADNTQRTESINSYDNSRGSSSFMCAKPVNSAVVVIPELIRRFKQWLRFHFRLSLCHCALQTILPGRVSLENQ